MTTPACEIIAPACRLSIWAEGSWNLNATWREREREIPRNFYHLTEHLISPATQDRQSATFVTSQDSAHFSGAGCKVWGVLKVVFSLWKPAASCSMHPQSTHCNWCKRCALWVINQIFNPGLCCSCALQKFAPGSEGCGLTCRWLALRIIDAPGWNWLRRRLKTQWFLWVWDWDWGQLLTKWLKTRDGSNCSTLYIQAW